jgi:hypothetical protein
VIKPGTWDAPNSSAERRCDTATRTGNEPVRPESTGWHAEPDDDKGHDMSDYDTTTLYLTWNTRLRFRDESDEMFAGMLAAMGIKNAAVQVAAARMWAEKHGGTSGI